MARMEGTAYTGVLTSDLTPVKDILVDLPVGGLIGVRLEQEGVAQVLAELAHAVATYGDEAEVRQAVYDRIAAATANIGKLRSLEIVLSKQLEVVRETLGLIENNREDDISSVALRVVETAKRQKKPGLLVHFEKTIGYRSQQGHKAAATRRKNKAANSPDANKNAG